MDKNTKTLIWDFVLIIILGIGVLHPVTRDVSIGMMALTGAVALAWMLGRDFDRCNKKERDYV